MERVAAYRLLASRSSGGRASRLNAATTNPTADMKLTTQNAGYRFDPHGFGSRKGPEVCALATGQQFVVLRKRR